MGIGTAKEGSESVVEPIGIGRNIGSDSDSSSIETDDEIGGREPDGQSGEEVDMERNESQEGGARSMLVIRMEWMVPNPRHLKSPRTHRGRQIQ